MPPHPHAQTLQILGQRIAWAQAHGLEDQVATLRAEYARAEADKSGLTYGRQTGPLDVPSMVVEMMTDAIWDDRVSREKVNPADPDRTVGHQSELWLADLKGRVNAGQFGAGEYQGQTYYSKHFVAHFGKETPTRLSDLKRRPKACGVAS